VGPKQPTPSAAEALPKEKHPTIARSILLMKLFLIVPKSGDQ